VKKILLTTFLIKGNKKKVIKKILEPLFKQSNLRSIIQTYPDIISVEYFIKTCPALTDNKISLDLGCGDNPQNPFMCDEVFGIDIRNEFGDDRIIVTDLFRSTLPFLDESISVITAHDFIEHVPRYNQAKGGETRFPFVILMSEIYRVLKKGGIFFSRTPAYPCTHAFQDPTHLNIITEETFPSYFCDHFWNGEIHPPLAKIYGFEGQFKLEHQKWCHHWLLTLLRKV
jgi:SAM-dependent methyltransferase